jgi:O-antigen ligase
LLLFYFVFKFFFVREQASGKLTNYIAVMAATVNLALIVISILEYFDIIPKFDKQFDISGGFVNPGALADFMVPFFPLLLSLFLLSGDIYRSVKIIVLITIFMSFMILLMTNARAAWLSGIISLVYVLCFYPKAKEFIHRIFNTKSKIIIAIVALIISITMGGIFLYNFKKTSSEGRLFIWKTCFGIIKEKPLLGNGYNSFLKIYNEHQIEYFKSHPEDLENGMLADSITFPCNDYLQLIIELGMLGMIIFSILIALVFIKTKNKSYQNESLVIGMKAGLLSILICALFSYPFKIANCQLLFFFFLAYLSSTIKGYNVSIPIKISFVIPITVISISTFVFLMQLKAYQTASMWKSAYYLTEEQKKQDAKKLYEETALDMNFNFYFLYNYGAFLYNLGDLNRSLEVLLKAESIQTNFELYMNIANVYGELSKYDNAEEYLTKAAYLIPHKFAPKYNLLKLYINTKQVEKANKMAFEINTMPVKVYSPIVGNIKKEVIKYLNKNTFQNNLNISR